MWTAKEKEESKIKSRLHACSVKSRIAKVQKRKTEFRLGRQREKIGANNFNFITNGGDKAVSGEEGKAGLRDRKVLEVRLLW